MLPNLRKDGRRALRTYHEEAHEYLEAMGVSDSGVTSLIQATYDLLGSGQLF